MANRDIASASVDPGGWTITIRITGMGSGGTYETGLGPYNDAIYNAKIALGVYSPGYDGSRTYANRWRSVIGTFTQNPYPGAVGAFYATANDYSVVITTGTVDSVSVVGTVLAHFSIENRFIEADITKIAGAAVSTSTAQLGVNAVQLGGTAQTGRDIGASVLLSSGTGAGQVSLASGAVTVGTNNDKTGYTASTVSDKTGYSLSTAPPTASDIATAVWGAATRTLTSFGSLVADAAAAVWAIVTSTLTGAGTIGKLLVDNINAAIGSRSSHSAADVKTAIEASGYSLAQILEDTGTTIPAQISGQNNLSSQQVQDAAVAALLAYDPPSKSELDSAITGLNNLSLAQAQEAAAAALLAYDPPSKSEMDSAITGLNTLLLRALGLMNENMRITGQTYDLNNNLTAATVTTYTDETLSTPRAVYTITATYSGNNCTSWRMVRVP